MPTNRQKISLIATLFLVAVMTNGVNMTEGIFYEPVRASFGFSRVQGATLASTTHLTTGLMLFVSGLLLKKIPPQFMQTAGFLLLGTGYLLIPACESYAALLGCFFLLGFGQGLVALLVVSPVIVNNWFAEGRNLALAIVYTGTSLGGSAITALIGNIVANQGWQQGYLVMATPMLLMPIVLLLFVRLRPRSNKVEGGPQNERKASEEGLTVAQGLALPSFWLLICAFFVYLVVSATIFLHFVPSLIEAGYSTGTAAERMSLLLLAAVPGKLLFGWLGDRIGVYRSLIFVLVLAAVALSIFGSTISNITLAVFMVGFGLAYSAPLVLMPIALAKLVGPRNFSVFAGIAMVFSNGGFALGPVMGGWLRDLSGSYGEVYFVLAASLVLAAVLIAASTHKKAAAKPLGDIYAA